MNLLLIWLPNLYCSLFFIIIISIMAYMFVYTVGKKTYLGTKSSANIYFQSIRCLPIDADKIQAAFNIATQNRLEDMNNYRSTSLYFYGFQAALVGGLFYVTSLIVKNDNLNCDVTGYVLVFLSIIACFGLIFALLWALAEISSRRWQENWEHHIDYLETYVTGDIYKTILYNEKSSFPRIREIKQIVTLVIILFWILVIFILMGLNTLLMCLITIFLLFSGVSVLIVLKIIKKRGILMLERRAND